MMQRFTLPTPRRPTSYKPSTLGQDLGQGITTEEREVQYRQLISRAVTQRLHSPSLSHLKFQDVRADTLEAWELRERLISRDKARLETKILGVAWEQFVQDVEQASREVHVLTPTQYEASLRKRNLEENRDATDKNAGLVFAQSEEQEKEKEWEERQRAMVKVMRIFGSARQGD